MALPIVMNPASQIHPELAVFGIRTPHLIDAYGMQRWYGEYPSMYLSTAGLIHQVQAHVRIRPTGRLTPRKQAALAVTGLAEPLTGHVGWDGTASRPGLQLADSCGGQIKT